MPHKREFDIANDIIPTRLDIYLVQRGLGLSRNQIQKGIREKWIRVVGKGTKPGFILRGGEHIIVELPETEPFRLVAENIPLNIVYEDDDIVIINKPAGMVVHPARGWWSGTLVHGLLYHINKLSSIGKDTRPGIVHRLDKDTSGLLVVAKSEKAHYHLASALAVHKIKRIYFALVWGSMPAEGIIDYPIAHNPRSHKKMAIVVGGKPARTKFTKIKDYQFLSSLRVELGTGRTHQIRVHLSYLGHPVFGDSDYGGRDERLKNIPTQFRHRAAKLLRLINHQALHAWELHFTHPITGKQMDFITELPEDIKNILTALGE